MTPSKTLFYFCIVFITGIALESLIKIPQLILWGFLISSILVIAVSFFTKKETAIIGFYILFLVLGIVRFQISEFNISKDKLMIFNDSQKNITFIGEISGERDIRDTSQKLKIKAEKLIIDNEQFNIKGLVLITINRYPEFKYLDIVKITGKLKTPIEFENFNYKNYLLKDGIYSVMDFPETELLSQKHNYNIFSFIYERILFFKENLRKSIFVNFPAPQSSILEGIILGNDRSMKKDLRDKLNATGLSHLTAISGSNIVILSYIVMALFLALGLWRGQAFYFSIISIWIYIILVGFPSSGIRAAIMGSIFLLSQKLGRQNINSRVIVIAASLMLLQNPLLLLYDVGFQLSFLASMGIIYLKPLIDNFISFYILKGRLFESGKNKFKIFLEIISVTFAAQIFTLPIIVYNFGSISLISPVTNILVLPIIPLLTILGFLASILGIFSNILGFIFSIPCWFLLIYFMKIVDIFYQMWAIKTIHNVSWVWLAFYYLVLLILITYLNKFSKPRFLGY